MTYTKEASNEMLERLENNFNITQVKVVTIHSFSFEIVRKSSKQRLETLKEYRFKRFIARKIKENIETTDSDFQSFYYKMMLHYNDDYIDEVDFETKADYVAEMRKMRYTTLKGEDVKSLAEKEIANFLYINRIEYEYEQTVNWLKDDSTEDRVYQPDFYLPEYDIYIEHWGIDRKGRVPDWFTWSSQQYREKMEWAREQFSMTSYQLVESYHFEYQTENYTDLLKKRLEGLGVEFDRMDFEEFIDSVYHPEDGLTKSFIAFINNAKTFNLGSDKILKRLDKNNKRQYYFGLCAIILLKQYQEFLEKKNLIDFNDMITKASKLIKQNPSRYYKRYDHVMVDEFQDVSINHINLIRPFFSGDSKTRLFCVGDDWQSIYSFQGSEPDYFIKFEEYFGQAAKTYLTMNYRCPKSILAAGNALISNNEKQIVKEVEAHSSVITRPILHVLNQDSSKRYQSNLANTTANLIKKMIGKGVEPDDIMVLCRFDGGAPYNQMVKDKLQELGIPYKGKGDKDTGDAVSIFSIHQSKGKEADNVILLHLTAEGYYSFPSPARDNDLIEPVKEVATNTVDEERRLFYVAITRVKKELHILTQEDNESTFIKEISDYLERIKTISSIGDVGARSNLVVQVDSFWEQRHSNMEQVGLLRDKTGRRIQFTTWKNSAPEILKKDIWYLLRNVKVGKYKDKKNITLDFRTEVINLYEYQK